MACVPLHTQDDISQFQTSFDIITRVTGLSDVEWGLGRKRQPTKSLDRMDGIPIRVVSSKKIDNSSCIERPGLSISFTGNGGQIDLSQDQHNLGVGPCHLIVLDCAKKSLLLNVDNQTLLSWFQPAIEACKSIVWVSARALSDPATNVGSGFIKTLLSENPQIRACHMTVPDTMHTEVSLTTALQSQIRLMENYNETEIHLHDSQILITRYQPDDELSVATNILPPREIHSSPNHEFYEVFQAPSGDITLRTGERVKSIKLNDDTIRINIKASAIDHSDGLLTPNATQAFRKTKESGHFFVGDVVDSNSSSFVPSSRVLGWYPGSHCSYIYARARTIFPIPNGIDPIKAVAQFAAYSLALALMDGVVRPLPGETITIRLPGVLGEALINVCQDKDIPMRDSSCPNGDFTLEYESDLGLLLNNQPVKPLKYLNTDGLRQQLNHYLSAEFSLKASLDVFDICEVQQAFWHARDRPCSTILSRKGKSHITSHWLTAAPVVRYFSPDASYVIVGGLGGLGRHLILWMVAYGAKHITSLSRKGLNSPGAGTIVEKVIELGGALDIRAVDACDLGAVRAQFAAIRSVRPIRGCFNLALQLANAHIERMTQQQWKSAILTKVQSSWNLHHASLEDSLDMFILFSSVSSITGNRTQANYAVANEYQNNLAEYRKSSLGLPGLSIALGAVKQMGVLADDHHLLQTLARSGLLCHEPHDFDRILMAAVLASLTSDRSMICTGVQRFKNVDGAINSKPHQNQLFWSEWPEFGFMFDYQRTANIKERSKTLSEKILEATATSRHQILLSAFERCLEDILGQPMSLEPDASMASCGLDSLNTIACRYWFYKELRVDISVFDILARKSVQEMLTHVLSKVPNTSAPSDGDELPQPSHVKGTLETRPASHSQQRMWFLHKYLDDKTVNNLLLECQVIGEIDIQAFSRAWSIFVGRHQSLHSRLVKTPRGLQQLPLEQCSFPLVVLRSTPGDHIGVCLASRQAARSHIFDIESGDLVRGWLVMSSTGQVHFFLASHHIAWDRSSTKTIFHETSAIYKSIRNHEDPMRSLNPHPYQIMDYTVWQNSCLQRPHLLSEEVRYWTTKLGEMPESTSLLPGAIVVQRPEVKSYTFEDLKVVLSNKTVESVKRHSQEYAITPFMFMAAILTLLTWGLTGDEDVTIGISDGDRGHSEFDDLVAFTVNMLAIRIQLKDKNVRYCDFIQEYRATCLEAYQHKTLPFDVLVQNLNIPRSTAHSQVFQIVLNYQMAGAFTDYDYGDFKLTNFTHYNAKPQSDIKLDVEETSDNELHCTWNFETALYDAEGMARVAEAFGQLLNSALLMDARAPICELIMDKKESGSLHRIGSLPSLLNTAIPNPFSSLFESAVSTFVNKKALVDNEGSITYGELDVSSAKIAGHLMTEQLEPGSRVGIFCDPGIHMAIAIYGALRAGLVYVPLEANSPRERLQRIIEDAAIRTVLTDDPVGSKAFPALETGWDLPCRVEDIKRILIRDQVTDHDKQNMNLVDTQNFCCIFTSGSTGTPKGIMVGHRQLRHQMQSYHDFLDTDDSDRMLLVSSAVFDMSLTSIYGAILRGATLFIADQESRYSPPRFLHFAAEWRITHCTLTTTQIKFLLRTDRKSFSRWTSLKSLVVGGEKVPPWIVADFYSLELPHARLYNGYGPAEATVCSALREILPIDQDETDIDVGRPLSPTHFHILDEHLEPIPQGSEGELYISGDTLSDGYLNRDDLTEASFLHQPKRDIRDATSVDSRIYRTGDIARLTAKGTYQILGRVGGDRQVKIRGMRVELSEIENAIYAVVKDLDQEKYGIGLVAVVYHAAEDILTAHLMTNKPHLQSLNDDSDFLAAVLLGLKSRLPSYMVPQQLNVTDDMPQTASGKLDYKAILATKPTNSLVEPSDGKLADKVSEQHVTMEIVKIWQTVLGTNKLISSSDDFFSLGGHSLLLLEVQQAILEEFGTEIRLVDLFTNSDLGSLVGLISRISCKTPIIPLHSISNQDEVRNRSSESGSLQVARPNENTPIDWAEETRIDVSIRTAGDRTQERLRCIESKSAKAVAIVGACTMAGSHLLFHILTTTDLHVHCVGIVCNSGSCHGAQSQVLDTLAHWGLRHHIDASCFERLDAYSGSLSQSALGLSQPDIAKITEEVDKIYVMDSEVSLLKRYEGLRQSNVGSLRFLVSMAATSRRSSPMEIHYLSTWGVPHMQSWKDTESSTGTIITDEVEMSHMKPSADGSLGYLKTRWVCEEILHRAARSGVPVVIYRSCMCGSSRISETPLDREDINRRILEGILQTGLVPEFGSDRGGGMSWISADFLVESIFHLSQQSDTRSYQARIYHIVSETHIRYERLAEILEASYDGTGLRTVEPSAWFKALKLSDNSDMVMHAEVLEAWTQSGWIPFRLNARSTLDALRMQGIVPPVTTKEFLMKHVIGTGGF
ncbi:MAG: hypothetical protein Q9222_002705 [Ikaeria aurantiellina]